MSFRRGNTVSPLIGCFSNALPVATQSLRLPSSKSRFSGRPLASTGNTPSEAAKTTLALARNEPANDKNTKWGYFIDSLSWAELFATQYAKHSWWSVRIRKVPFYCQQQCREAFY